MTRAHAKKLKESLQVLVHTVHDQVAQASVIEGLKDDGQTLYTLLEIHENEGS